MIFSNSLKNIYFLVNRHLFLRYILAGGLSSFLDIFVLFVLVKIFDIYYLSGATLAMTISFIVRFWLQKFFAFRNNDKLNEKTQLMSYSILYIFSLLMTNFLLIIFVEKFNFQIMISQIFAIVIIACLSFFIYKKIIFK